MKNKIGSKEICLIILIIVVVIFLITTLFSLVPLKEVAAKEVREEPKSTYKEARIEENKLDLIPILEENKKKIKTQQIQIENIDIEYTTNYQNNALLPKGEIQVLQEGRDGSTQKIIKKTYQEENLLSEEIIADKIIKGTVEKIVQIGTAPYTSNQKIKAGEIAYVTPYTLGVMLEPKKEAQKMYTIKKEDNVKIEKIEGEWCYIVWDNGQGFVPKNCLTYIDPKKEAKEYDSTIQGLSKQSLLNQLNFQMALNKPSGLTLEQFKKVLSGNKQDTNKILQNNAEYFFYIEKQYKINGIFVAAVGIHESGWGSSKIALNKKNLFGYGASDTNPYENAYDFSSYAEGIDLLARVFVKYYINPKGTPIYDGQVASGSYYFGNTLSSVNKKYASDKKWANGVYHWMQYLYNRI